jgi:hypothetical protein
MVDALANDLVRVVDEAASSLRALDDAVAAARPGPEVWSIKEIVGHLIDSAANNHQRFVRAQQDDVFTWPGYEQNFWVASQDPQSRPWRELVDLWTLYNHHLAHTIRRIPERALNATCRIGGSGPVTLGFLLHDYLTHLRRHLDQIERRHPRPAER